MTLERQKELGVVPPDTELAPWADGVPHWDELDRRPAPLAARLMETYAGFAEHADAQVGRLVDALEDLGVLDNTLVRLHPRRQRRLGRGRHRGHDPSSTWLGHGIVDDLADMDRRLDEIGRPTS